jgi:hypothetical protein
MRGNLKNQPVLRRKVQEGLTARYLFMGRCPKPWLLFCLDTKN